MDVGRSISFVFQDKKWIEKILIGGLVTLVIALFSWTLIVPILGGALLAGYALGVVRNVRKGEPDPLPEWTEWWDKIVDGIKLVVLLFIYSLPGLLITAPGSVANALSQGEGFGAFLGGCFAILGMLYNVVLIFFIPAITIRYAETGAISAGLQVGEVIAYTRDNIGDAFIAVIAAWVISIIAVLVGIILCGIGILFTGFWAMLVQAHLYGQVGRKGSVSTDLAAPQPGAVTIQEQVHAEHMMMEEISSEEVEDATADAADDDSIDA
ncbi:MAG: DUF4013 domain-containing protein [Caldilineales bacterium]|nr:DUF4013 domain-containing protein [Caldilineales bacterium]